MSIHDKNKQTNQAPAAAQQQPQVDPQMVQQPQGQPAFDPMNPQGGAFGQQQQPFQQNYQQQFQQPQQPGVDFQQQQFSGFGNPNQQNEATARIARLSQALSPVISRGGTSERAAQFVKTAQEILEIDKSTTNRYKLITLTPEHDSVALTTIAVARSEKNTSGQDVVVVHSLIVEGGKIEPRKFNINGFHQQQIQIESTAGDTYTETYWQILVGKLAKTFGTNAVFEDAHANIIASEVDLKDATAVRNILSAATTAVDNTLELFTNPNRFVITAAELKSDQQIRLTSAMDFNPTEALTSNGLPVRSDIAITTSLVPVANMQNKDFTNPKLNLVTTDVYLDLAYVGNQSPMQMMGGQYNPYMNNAYKTYAPRVVITNIDSQHTLSTEMLVMGIVNATLLSNQQAWIAGFRNKTTASGGPGIRNIAAVGYEVPGLVDKPGLVDLGAVSIPDLVNTVCHDQLIYSLDVPEIGDNSYIENIFIAAANGDIGAYNAIIAACNNITNNMFGQMWQSGNAILVDDKCRIHNGYFYFDNKAVDFREMDYLTILGLFGERNPENVAAYANTFRPDATTELQRLEERYRILQLAEGAGHMHLKGYSRRLTFTSQFIGALLGSFTHAGLTISLDNGHYDNTTQRRYTMDGLAQFAFNPMQSGLNYNSLFNTPTMTGVPNWQYGRTSAWVM